MLHLALTLGGLLADSVTDISPTARGMPGGALARQILSWLFQGALWGSFAALLIGAGLWGFSQHAGNYAGASRGKAMAFGGAVGALMSGLAPQAIEMLFKAGKAGG